mmetsp:Transcript_59016/g.157809  ORF Transcript_59016/g.157809 Transcript_59016/m.157809 type:complete len:319 (+) Transcript_59016:1062-2018(+)
MASRCVVDVAAHSLGDRTKPGRYATVVDHQSPAEHGDKLFRLLALDHPALHCLALEALVVDLLGHPGGGSLLILRGELPLPEVNHCLIPQPLLVLVHDDVGVPVTELTHQPLWNRLSLEILDTEHFHLPDRILDVFGLFLPLGHGRDVHLRTPHLGDAPGHDRLTEPHHSRGIEAMKQRLELGGLVPRCKPADHGVPRQPKLGQELFNHSHSVLAQVRGAFLPQPDHHAVHVVPGVYEDDRLALQELLLERRGPRQFLHLLPVSGDPHGSSTRAGLEEVVVAPLVRRGHGALAAEGRPEIRVVGGVGHEDGGSLALAL